MIFYSLQNPIRSVLLIAHLTEKLKSLRMVPELAGSKSKMWREPEQNQVTQLWLSRDCPLITGSVLTLRDPTHMHVFPAKFSQFSSPGLLPKHNSRRPGPYIALPPAVLNKQLKPTSLKLNLPSCYSLPLQNCSCLSHFGQKSHSWLCLPGQNFAFLDFPQSFPLLSS